MLGSYRVTIPDPPRGSSPSLPRFNGRTSSQLNHLQAPTPLFQLEAQMTQLSAINFKLLCTAFIMVKWGGLKTTILFEIRFVSGEATCANVPVVYTRPSLTCSILQTVCRVEYYRIS